MRSLLPPPLTPKRLKYTLICFQIGKSTNALDLISNRLIHRELLMVTNIVHFPSDIPCPADLPDPGIEARSPALQVDSLPAEPPGKSLAILVAMT